MWAGEGERSPATCVDMMIYESMSLVMFIAIVLLGFCAANADDLGYSPDGGLVSFGEFDYVYDSASRLTEVWSNGVRGVENQYDALGRRVVKRSPATR